MTGDSVERKQPMTLYEGINGSVAALVPLNAERILDVGCGTGALGKHLRDVRERYVAGITYSDQEAHIASERLSMVICADLNTFDFCSLGNFDCVVLSHVLEHLYSPAALLERLQYILEPNALVVVALPNVVWWKQRLQFLIGRWRYQDWGVLDRTHFRFFDQQSSAQLLEDAGYEILDQRFEGPFPMGSFLRGFIGTHTTKLDRYASQLLPGLLAMQFLYVVKPRLHR